ncbi:hypothetical protein ACEPAF_2987 [Sanghuangporus sanghuang]|uniref:Polysaccharide lyase 14 domain-containing protein n=1 Tax=Sanghuangporus baumii TaxID=108892 RepID=A0A9Q5N9P5_SANBA|nr:hypothetical protein A7U60_g928 [Sanghuangporus baumii]
MKSFARSLTLFLSFSGLTGSTLAFAPTQRPHVRAVHSKRALELERRSLQSNLFPADHVYSSGFTTADGVSVDGVSSVDLSDKALNVIKVQSGMTHNVVQQNGKTAWEAVYPAGSWNPSNQPLGGFGFYLGGSDDFYNAILNGAQEVVLGYSVMFENGFEFNKGGKLPGAFGGNGDSAFGCSGGRQDGRSQCFDARLMWRSEGAGELYTYLPLTDSNAKAQLSIEGTIANDQYGYSVARGSFSFPSGEWVAISQRIKLNTPGQSDGQIKLWVNGEETIKLYNVTLSESDGATIQGLQFQTFFGGSTSDWASPKTQKAWFADVTGAVISD